MTIVLTLLIFSDAGHQQAADRIWLITSMMLPCILTF